VTASRVKALAPPRLEEVRAARERIRGLAVRTPLLRLPLEDVEIHLKVEALQPIGSFKIRGAGNAMLSAPRNLLDRGVYTASAGNMAQGVAWCARQMGIPCTVVVPDDAPRAKLDAIERLGARALLVPFSDWWTVLEEHRYPGLEGLFVHPVADPAVIAGNGTIGLEILEDLPDVDAVLVPFGGGGLSGGIASAIRAEKPGVPVYACEIETAAPLAASWAAGAPRSIERIPSFVDGIGGKCVLPEMWDLLRGVLEGPLVVSLEEAASAIRLLVARARVVAEGAGAVPVAAALAGRAGRRRLACVVSGGNIDPQKLATILGGGLP
jgi:threonine dehydratase